MGKLTPKPTSKVPTKNWEDLDEHLQRTFKNPQFQWAVVNPAEYIMDKQEIIDECKLAGYEVSETPDGQLEVR